MHWLTTHTIGTARSFGKDFLETSLSHSSDWGSAIAAWFKCNSFTSLLWISVVPYVQIAS
jgi:hypothetical protein